MQSKQIDADRVTVLALLKCADFDDAAELHKQRTLSEVVDALILRYAHKATLFAQNRSLTDSLTAKDGRLQALRGYA